MKFSIQKVKLRFDEQQIGKRIYLCSVISVSILVLVCGFFLHFFFQSMVDKACNKLQEIFSKTSLVKKKRFIRAYSIVPFVKTKNLQNGHRTVFTASTKNSSNEMFFIVKNSYEQRKKILKFPPLAQMGSYHYLMSEETFLPTAICHKFWVVSSTTFDRDLRTASRNVYSKKRP